VAPGCSKRAQKDVAADPTLPPAPFDLGQCAPIAGNDNCDNQEEKMRVTKAIRGIFAQISIATIRRRSAFNCGDCERSDRCGLPPSDTCMIRAEQIARGDWKARRRAKALRETARWI